MSVIYADFKPETRRELVNHIRHYGVKYTIAFLLSSGVNPSFAKAIVRSICRKEGW